MRRIKKDFKSRVSGVPEVRPETLTFSTAGAGKSKTISGGRRAFEPNVRKKGVKPVLE